MGKGRRLTISRSERFLSSYGYSNGHVNGGIPELELTEEDIWSAVDDDDVVDRGTLNSGGSWRPHTNRNTDHEGCGMEPTWGRHMGGLSLTIDGRSVSSSRIAHQISSGGSPASTPRAGGRHHMAASAPVNVPDWRKILRTDSVDSLHDDSHDGAADGGEMVPPHEYVARSRKASGASVFEGVGRTLKGRDMRRVRDAVWSQTGFYG